MSEAFLRDVRAATEAGVRLLCVVTHEERRALEILGHAFPEAKVLGWTATAGWSDDASTREPIAAVQRAARRERGVVRVMLDAHPWLGDPLFVRALRDLVAVEREAPLCLVMPTAQLPPELDRDARVVALPLPDATALSAALESQRLDP